MATINKVNKVTSVGDGILMPQLKHQWRIRFAGQNIPFSAEQKQMLAMQTMACSMDYHLKTLSIVIEQDRFTSYLHNMVKRFSALSKTTTTTSKISFMVDMLDGNNETLKSFSFEGCILIAHLFDLDYTDSGSARHKIKFSYKTTKEL